VPGVKFLMHDKGVLSTVLTGSSIFRYNGVDKPVLESYGQFLFVGG